MAVCWANRPLLRLFGTTHRPVALTASLAQLLDDNPILTRTRNSKLFRGFRDCFLLVRSLNHPEMFEAMPVDVDEPAGHSSHQRP
jgi:hypothetical protein